MVRDFSAWVAEIGSGSGSRFPFPTRFRGFPLRARGIHDHRRPLQGLGRHRFQQRVYPPPPAPPPRGSPRRTTSTPFRGEHNLSPSPRAPLVEGHVPIARSTSPASIFLPPRRIMRAFARPPEHITKTTSPPAVTVQGQRSDHRSTGSFVAPAKIATDNAASRTPAHGSDFDGSTGPSPSQYLQQSPKRHTRAPSKISAMDDDGEPWHGISDELRPGHAGHTISMSPTGEIFS